MKACIAILVLVVACANAGYLHGGLYGYAAAPFNYGYAYGYNYPTAYSYAAYAPAISTVAYPAIRTVAYAPAPIVRAVHHTTPVVAKTIGTPVAVTSPISVATPVVRHAYSTSTPIVRTLAYAPAISYANNYAYGDFGISPYTSAILLKK